MSYQKTGVITGVNPSHPLAAKVHEIRDFGQTIRDVISDTTVTSPATFVNDPELGPCRLFTSANIGMDTLFPVPVAAPNYGTLLIICRGGGSYQGGANSIFTFMNLSASGDRLEFEYRGYSNPKQEIKIRANGVQQYDYSYNTAPTDQSAYEAATCYALTVSRNPLKFYRNGTEQANVGDALSDLGSDFSATTMNLDMLTFAAADADHYISAIVSLEELTAAELASLTSDPAPLFEMEVSPTLALDQATLSPGGTISGTASNYDTAPTSPISVSDGTNTDDVAVTISGTGPYTFTGTMPAEPTVAEGSVTVTVGEASTTATYDDGVTAGLSAFTLNKDGSALGNLTGIKCRIVAGAELDGSEVYSANDLTATSGVMDSDISLSGVDVGDTVTVCVLTTDNEGIAFTTTVENLQA